MIQKFISKFWHILALVICLVGSIAAYPCYVLVDGDSDGGREYCLCFITSCFRGASYNIHSEKDKKYIRQEVRSSVGNNSP